MIMMKMRSILSSDDEYTYLNDEAFKCLAQCRSAFRSSGMGSCFTSFPWGIRMTPWLGSRKFDTLRRIVLSSTKCRIRSFMPYYIDIFTDDPIGTEDVIRYRLGNIDPERLILSDDELRFGKFDDRLPDELLRRSFIRNKLDSDITLG